MRDPKETELIEPFQGRESMPSPDKERFDAQTGELLLDKWGREVPDPNPMQPPVGYNRQPSLSEQMRAMIVSHNLAKAAAEAGLETFEEADDFEIGDDWDEEKKSPYEANFDPMTPHERAALASQGRDPEKILTDEEKASLFLTPPKPLNKKKPGVATSDAPVSEALSAEDQQSD